MKEVAEQMRIVSIKTDSICTSPCFDRVGDSGAGGRVGRGPHTGLVGEQSPLDTVHDAGSGKAAEDGLQVEGAGEDGSANICGIKVQMGHDDKQRRAAR